MPCTSAPILVLFNDTFSSASVMQCWTVCDCEFRTGREVVMLIYGNMSSSAWSNWGKPWNTSVWTAILRSTSVALGHGVLQPQLQNLGNMLWQKPPPQLSLSQPSSFLTRCVDELGTFISGDVSRWNLLVMKVIHSSKLSTQKLS
jgi:hypothetical protein